MNARPAGRRFDRFAGAVVAILTVAPALMAEEPAPVEEQATYGKTPDTAIPYRNFAAPYNRFFQKRMGFLGAGREPAGDRYPTARIGLFGPAGSAPDADLGRQMREGVQLAIEQANDDDGYVDPRGGTPGIPFELVERYDVGLWGASSNEMVGFKYDDDVLAVIGSIDGANTHIALRVALKIQMPMINTATTDPTLTETNIPWLMRCMADDRQQGYALAHHIFHVCGIERVAALRVNDRYGRTGIAEFRDAARRLRHPLLLELRWQRGDRDFAVQLDRLSETDVEAVVLWGNAADAAAVVRQMRQRAMPWRIFGCDRLVSRTFLTQAGEAAEGVVAVATYNPTRVSAGGGDSASLSAFTEAFVARFHHEPETFAAHAYDGANILIAAIRKAGLNRARIRDALYEVARYDGVTGPIIFDTTLNDIGPVHIATVEDGQFIYSDVDFSARRSTANAAQLDPAGMWDRLSSLSFDRLESRSHRHPVASRSIPSARIPRGGVPAAPYRTLAQSPPVPPRAGSARMWDRLSSLSFNRLESRSHRHLAVGCFLPLDAAGEAAVRGARMALADAAARHPNQTPVDLLVRDARGLWGDNASSLVDLVLEERVLALIGSTERRATHLAEMLAAKFHFPIVTLCGTDPSVTQIPLPWVFCIAGPEAAIDPDFAWRYHQRYGLEATVEAALGYDAAALVASGVGAGADHRRALRDNLAARGWTDGVSGTFRFDVLGNRIDRFRTTRGQPEATPRSESPESPPKDSVEHVRKISRAVEIRLQAWYK